MKIEIVCPEQFLGDVLGDLNARRARIEEIRERGKIKLVDGTVPLGSMFGYATSIRSLSQGRASYSMEPKFYQEVPKNLADEIIQKETLQKEAK